jgi:hypothetical protein
MIVSSIDVLGISVVSEGARVRVSEDRRRHILDGDANGGGHRHGTGSPGKTEFPAAWDDNRVIAEIESVANDPRSKRRLRFTSV